MTDFSPVCVADVAVFLTWPLTLPARLVAPEEAWEAVEPAPARGRSRLAGQAGLRALGAAAGGLRDLLRGLAGGDDAVRAQ